ncbi:sulfotransferase family 2 domain-containing protein [Oceanicella actignis]|uniref:Sulfotransferase family protein n=1 Tax=Oceanicella actignis TaxID=1189325 RepID=A0A1M7T4P6_9RHOB|nr:sulfotransferase family 2 domain-containing protein [Oceanicella actignis]TYO88768.1 sulfotransferase family protein [Oceanicella actignis]SET42167.1 Sulfotransferase family protein [Oceanicella actignis]SHN65713.1 Sulfotransferase family protein [Oceanicella actignis]
MPYALHEGRVIFFAHVPKAGGSSVEDHMAARFGPLGLLDRGWMQGWIDGRWRDGGLAVSPQHLAAADLRGLLPRTPDAAFAVVRDPVARIVSEYRFQARASRPLSRPRLARLGFDVWLRATLAAARRDPRVFDNHIRPQSDIVPEGARVFRLEDGLDAVAEWLDQVAGPPPQGQTPGGRIGHALRSTGAPIRPGRAELALIARFYARDYARFGYPPPDLDAAPARTQGGLAPRPGWRARLWRGAGAAARPVAPLLGPGVAAAWRRGRI